MVFVDEPDTIRACYELAKHGFLFGGSTGTVVHAAVKWLKENKADGRIAVAIAPDLGERYTRTIYSDEWVMEHFGKEILN